MKFLGFLIFVFVFLMAFWAIIFLASVIPYFIFVWANEGKLEKDQIPAYVNRLNTFSGGLPITAL